MDFKAIIKEQRQELVDIEKRERIIPREFLPAAQKILSQPNILAVLGPRRCGKSIFSYLLAKENNFGYINFDDERLADVKTSDLDKIMQAFHELYKELDFIVLDELQNIKKWELFANRLRRTKKVIITGSNSNLLAGELAAHLTGRHLDITLLPFSFREFLLFYKIDISENPTTKERAVLRNQLERYFEIGGFPETAKFGRPILAGIYDDIISKDILLRHKIRKTEEIKKLARYLLTNFAKEFSYNKLSNLLNVQHIATLSKWISYLEDSFLLFQVERFSFKLKQQIIAPKKAYCVDSGLLNVVGFSFSENRGYFMENTVAIELFRKKAADYSLDVFYWKDHQQNEVDFVLKRGKNVKTLIQVTKISEAEEIAPREKIALLKASKELRCGNLLVITDDFEGKEKFGGKTIKFIPLWKWLLSVDY